MERWCFDASADWLEACGGQRGNPKDIERTQRTWAMPKNSHPRSVHRVVNFAGFFTSISSGLSSALGDKRKCAMTCSSSLLSLLTLDAESVVRCRSALRTYGNMTVAFSLLARTTKSPQIARFDYPKPTCYCRRCCQRLPWSLIVAKVDRSLPFERRKIFESHLAAVQGQS
jgi:hypothetical protein